MFPCAESSIKTNTETLPRIIGTGETQRKFFLTMVELPEEGAAGTSKPHHEISSNADSTGFDTGEIGTRLTQSAKLTLMIRF